MATISISVIGKGFHNSLLSISLFFFLFKILDMVLIEHMNLLLYSCKKLVAAKKQMSILQAPNILVIQLKVG